MFTGDDITKTVEERNIMHLIDLISKFSKIKRFSLLTLLGLVEGKISLQAKHLEVTKQKLPKNILFGFQLYLI